MKPGGYSDGNKSNLATRRVYSYVILAGISSKRATFTFTVPLTEIERTERESVQKENVPGSFQKMESCVNVLKNHVRLKEKVIRVIILYFFKILIYTQF